MKKLLQIWRRLSTIGKYAERSDRENRCLQICNQVALIIAGFLGLYAPLYLILGHPEIALFTFSSGVLVLTTVPANRSLRYPLLGRNLFLLFNNGIILGYCVILGKGCWPHLFFLNMMIVPYILFPPQNHWHIKLWSVTAPLFFFGLEFWGFSFFSSIQILSPEQQQKVYWLISPSVFAIALIYANYLYRTINRHEKALLHRIKELQQSNKTIEEQQLHLAAATHFSAIAELSASVAHEINNPLAIIRGYAEQLEILLRRKDFVAEHFNIIAQRIKQTVDRITKITSSLRNLSREGSEDPLEEVDLKKLIEEVLAICKEGLLQDGIDLRVDIGPDRAPCICRQVQIAQVLLSLIHNAKDAVAPLSEKWIHIKLETKDNFYEIAIVDSGHGISPDILPRIHQPFFTTKSPGKGTGLGLSISRKIVTAHQGQLFVDTRTKHTSFIMRLPKDARV